MPSFFFDCASRFAWVFCFLSDRAARIAYHCSLSLSLSAPFPYSFEKEQRESPKYCSPTQKSNRKMAARDGSGAVTTTGADACCSAVDHRDSAAAHLSARALRLEQELDDDPTLQDCCRRDLEQEAKASRQQAALSRVDRAARAELARKLGGAVVPPPPRAEKDDDLESDFDDLDDDDDDEASLAQLRDLRLSQLKLQQREQKERKRENNDDLGPGRLSEVKTSKVFSLAASLSRGGTRKKELPFVVHLADAGSSTGASLDELLETLAGDFRGSRFARAGGGPSSKSTEVRASVLAAASLVPSAAAAAAAREGAGGVLAVFRGGFLVAAVPVSAFCSGEGGGAGGELIEESAVAWLRKCRGLFAREKVEKSAKTKKKKREGDDEDDAGAPSSSSDDEGEDNSDEDADPCEVCGRTYFHTHVRPVRSGGGGGGDESDDDESGSD